MTKNQAAIIIRFVVTELFYVSLVAFGFFSFLESVSPGFVSHSLNTDVLLFLAIGSGIFGFSFLAAYQEKDSPKQKGSQNHRTITVVIAGIAIVCGFLVYLQMRGQGITMAILLGAASSVIVALIALTAITEEIHESD
ncbi:MAG: hypothetical protein V1778_03535 [bacterium]